MRKIKLDLHYCHYSIFPYRYIEVGYLQIIWFVFVVYALLVNYIESILWCLCCSVCVMFCRSFIVFLPFYLLAIVLFVLLRFTASDNRFAIFKPFLCIKLCLLYLLVNNSALKFKHEIFTSMEHYNTYILTKCETI